MAAALPGGDPLAAALAAGETPSPDMVAAAGGVGGLHPFAAAVCIALCVAAMVGSLVFSEARGLPFGPDDKPYAALRDRANDFMHAMRMMGKEQSGDGFSRLKEGSLSAPGAARRDVFYWHRRSPEALFPVIEERASLGASPFALPALEVPGEAAARLDLRGRLLEFRRVPPAGDTLEGRIPDWAPLFAAAGITDRRSLAGPRDAAPVPTDTRQAWNARTPEGIRRVEAGTYRGIVTFFSVGPPYVTPVANVSNLITNTIGALLLILVFAISVIVARRNLTVGRADLRGAIRLSSMTWLLGLFGWGFFARPNLSWPGSITMFTFSIGAFFAAFHATAYLALEPIVRRTHPHWLASWTRLLDGRWLDPLVGRHVVVGTLAGLLCAMISGVRGYLAKSAPYGDFQAAAVGGWTALGVILRGIDAGVLQALMITLLLVALLFAVRRWKIAWLAWAVWILGNAALQYRNNTEAVPGMILVVIQTSLLAMVLHRFGVLPLAIASSVYAMLNEEYLTLHLGAWYSGVTIAALIALGAILLWGTAAALRSTRDPRTL